LLKHRPALVLATINFP